MELIAMTETEFKDLDGRFGNPHSAEFIAQCRKFKIPLNARKPKPFEWGKQTCKKSYKGKNNIKNAAISKLGLCKSL